MTTNYKVGYVYDDEMLRHTDPFDHVECPERIKAIHYYLKNTGQLDRMIKIPSRRATNEELVLAHTSNYINKVNKLLCQSEEDMRVKIFVQDRDMFANKYTLECAQLAAGSTLNLVQHIVDGQIDRGIAIVRPPGHHAHKNKFGGFCWFNNIAIATLWARQKKRVAVIDWDIHQGDGSKDILKNRENVLLISVHRSDRGQFYPGNGQSVSEANTIMIGLDRISGDDEYIKIFKERVIPELDKFKPELILVSAGFDAGKGDPLGGYHVTPNCFGLLTRFLLEVCPKMALILEGGYNLDTISKSMSACVDELLNF